MRAAIIEGVDPVAIEEERQRLAVGMNGDAALALQILEACDRNESVSFHNHGASPRIPPNFLFVGLAFYAAAARNAGIL